MSEIGLSLESIYYNSYRLDIPNFYYENNYKIVNSDNMVITLVQCGQITNYEDFNNVLQKRATASELERTQYFYDTATKGEYIDIIGGLHWRLIVLKLTR